MIKFTAQSGEGATIYGFGLTEANLNRLEFNKEPIFFDFGYAGHPELFGLISYLDQFEEPEYIAADINAAKESCIPFFDSEHGVTPKTLHFFPIAQSVMQKFRSTPFWGCDTQIQITHPCDAQLIFAGRTEKEIEEYLQSAGFISPQTKRSYKGFEKRATNHHSSGN